MRTGLHQIGAEGTFDRIQGVFLIILDIRHSTFDSGNLLAEACGVVDPEEDYNEDEMSRKACAVLQILALESVPEAVFAASFASESDGESCASPEETSP